MIPAPYVGAVVQVRPAGSPVWLAAIVTRLCEDRQQHRAGGWMPAIDVAAFRLNGGIYPMRFVGRRSVAEAVESDDPTTEDEWRWPNEGA